MGTSLSGKWVWQSHVLFLKKKKSLVSAQNQRSIFNKYNQSEI